MAAAIRCVAASMVLLAGCGGGGGGGSVSISAFGVNGTAAPAPPPAANPPPPAPPASPMVVKVTELASGLNSPWGLAFLPDGKLLVTQRGGQMRLRNGDGTPVNGGADQVSGVPVVEAVGQGGLLDVVVDPAFASNRRIYFSYSERDTGNASLNSTAVARAELDVAAAA